MKDYDEAEAWRISSWAMQEQRRRRRRIGFWIVGVALMAAAFFGFAYSARAQGTIPGLPIVPVGYCQIATLSSSVALSACVRGNFTGTGAGTNLTASAVTGVIKVGDLLAGTGVPAGTTVVSQASGTPGGAGVYVTSVATTSSGAALTAGGIPPTADIAVLSPETQAVRYRDDGGVPTASIGQPIASGAVLFYSGTLSALRFIEQTASAKLNITFYASP